MIYSLRVPGTLEGMSQVRILEWHGDVGQRFEPGDMIVELETHKAVIEVRADQTGVLRRQFCEEGTWCPLEGIVAVLSDHEDEPLPELSEDLGALSASFSIG